MILWEIFIGTGSVLDTWRLHGQQWIEKGEVKVLNSVQVKEINSKLMNPLLLKQLYIILKFILFWVGEEIVGLGLYGLGQNS